MTVLEATVEIVKSALQGSQAGFAFVTKKEDAEKLAEGIEIIYKKLEELDKYEGPKGYQEHK